MQFGKKISRHTAVVTYNKVLIYKLTIHSNSEGNCQNKFEIIGSVNSFKKCILILEKNVYLISSSALACWYLSPIIPQREHTKQLRLLNKISWVARGEGVYQGRRKV